jgi:hypothetical protein
MLQKLLQYLRLEHSNFPCLNRSRVVICSRFCPIDSGEQRAAAQALVERKGSMSVKYTPFNFQCKYPVKLRDSSLKSTEL